MQFRPEVFHVTISRRSTPRRSGFVADADLNGSIINLNGYTEITTAQVQNVSLVRLKLSF